MEPEGPARPGGSYMARVYLATPVPGYRAAAPMRKHIYNLLGLPVKLHASLQAGPSSLSEFV